MQGYINDFLSGEDVTAYENGNMDSDTAMKYNALFACVRVLSETVASMPIKIYRKLPNGERESVSNELIYDVLHNKPNSEMSPFSFKEQMMISLNLGGNSVSEKLFNSKGELVGLYPYQHQDVQIDRNKESGKLEYKIGGKTLQREQVFHVAGMSFDGVVGLPPIEYIATAIRLGLSYEQFGVNFYKNGANSSGVIEHPEGLDDEHYQRLKKDFEKSYQGLANTGKPIILEGGAKFNQLTIKPADAQLIESKKFQIEDIARVYRMPLHLIQNLDRATNNNIEHQSLEFVKFTMLPWFQRIEEAINCQLLTAEQRLKGYYAEFKIDALLRGDMKSRYDSYAVGRQWGFMSVNEIRKLENMNAVENGDILLQPSNMIEAGGGEE